MDVLGDFVSQLPAGLILWTVAAFLALIASVILMLIGRRRPGFGASLAWNMRRLSAHILSRAGDEAPEESAMEEERPEEEMLPEPDFDTLVGGVEEADEDASGGTVGLPRAVEPSPVLTPHDEAADMIEILRIWRDLADGSMVIEIEGEYYRQVHEITDPALYRRFLSILRELAKQARAVEASGGPGRATPPVTPRAEAIPSKITGVPPTAQQPPPPQGDSIAAQIEAFLQYKLQHSEFSARSIHVREAIGGGVRIEVDGHFYEGIGDVIDPDVREFLRRTIKEWEARQ